jgi:ribosomal protein S12 methylthiotransferase accessory factor
VDEARARCVGEAVERFSIQLHGDEAVIHARYRDLGPVAVHPNEILLLSAAQVQNSGDPGIRAIQRFDEDTPIPWVRAASLTGDGDRLIAAGLCRSGYLSNSLAVDSNGCGAGPDIGYATRSATFELIERDAVAIWWYNRISRPELPLARVARGWSDLLGLFRIRKRSVRLLDLTTDIGVPVCAAVSTTQSGSHIVVGSAAGLAIQSAAWRATAECAASLLSLEGHQGKGASLRESRLLNWFRNALLSEHSHLAPSQVVAAMPKPVPANRLFECVSVRGVNLYSVDLTRPELRIPAIRVLGPGLRHWHPRFAPGRLYDVPVGLGWVGKQTTEAEMNPIPFPF